MTDDQITAIVQLFRAAVKTIPTVDDLFDIRERVGELESRILTLETRVSTIAQNAQHRPE